MLKIKQPNGQLFKCHKVTVDRPRPTVFGGLENLQAYQTLSSLVQSITELVVHRLGRLTNYQALKNRFLKEIAKMQ